MLPSYMYDLSPTELVWSEVENYVFKNVTWELSLKQLLDLTTEGTAKDWEDYCQHVEQLERDEVVADIIDTIISNPNGSSDDENLLLIR